MVEEKNSWNLSYHLHLDFILLASSKFDHLVFSKIISFRTWRSILLPFFLPVSSAILSSPLQPESWIMKRLVENTWEEKFLDSSSNVLLPLQ